MSSDVLVSEADWWTRCAPAAGWLLVGAADLRLGVLGPSPHSVAPTCLFGLVQIERKTLNAKAYRNER